MLCSLSSPHVVEAPSVSPYVWRSQSPIFLLSISITLTYALHLTLFYFYGVRSDITASSDITTSSTKKEDISRPKLEAASEGWFGVSIDGAPTRYLHRVDELNRWSVLSCIHQIDEGDLISITRRPNQCEVKTDRLTARTLLAFGVALDVNQATVQELSQIKGVGPRLALKITKNRPWHTVESLRRLRGVGPHILHILKQHLRTSPPRRLYTKSHR